MNILFTSMPIDLHNRSDLITMRTVPTTAIYLLTAILKTHGYFVDILDPYVIKTELIKKSFQEIMVDSLKDKDVLCLSSNTLNWPMTIEAIQVARKIKGNNLKIILGGLHPTYFYQHIYKNFDIDYILIGEGESTLVELLQCIENDKGLENIQGLVSKCGSMSAVNFQKPMINENQYKKLPLPAFDLLPDKVYYALPIETSRGCKFNCKFCSIVHRNNWRAFDKEIVINRNEQIISLYQSKFINKEIFITDDCLTTDFERANAILGNLINNSPESKIMVETRITDWQSNLRDSAVPVFSMKQINRLGFGIECGYNEGLKRIAKGLTIEILEDTLKFLDQNKLIQKTFLSFIIGFPWESMDDCLKTINYAANIVKRYGQGIVNVNWLWLYPSELWEQRKDYGIDLGENVFDDPNYKNHSFFSQTHPSISNSERRYLEQVIKDYEDREIYLRNY